ncbi:helix-turn-helix domain-containing protein [Spirillospora sp. NPDC049024]
MGAPKPKVWFNTEEAAEFMGLTKRQMQRLIWEKKIAVYRPTGRPQFHRDTLTEFLADSREEAAHESQVYAR